MFLQNFIKLDAAVHMSYCVDTENRRRWRKQYCRRFRGQ